MLQLVASECQKRNLDLSPSEIFDLMRFFSSRLPELTAAIQVLISNPGIRKDWEASKKIGDIVVDYFDPPTGLMIGGHTPLIDPARRKQIIEALIAILPVIISFFK